MCWKEEQHKNLNINSRLIVVLLLLLLGSGCKRSSKLSSALDTADGIIHGQVFVVTRGAENIRLGELKVYLVPRLVFDDLKLGERGSNELSKLMRALAIAKKNGDETEGLVSEIKVNYLALLTQRDQMVERLLASQLLHSKYNAVKEEINRRDDALGAFQNGLESMPTDSYGEFKETMAALKSLHHRLALSTYERLMPYAASCKTDADGRFRFECSLNQEYVVFTRGQRQTSRGSGEVYEWFVSARPSANEKRQVLLTNDNLIEGSAADNLMRGTVDSVNDIVEETPLAQSRHLPSKRKPFPVEPHWAPAGNYFLIFYRSIPTSTGVIGLAPGSQVKEQRHEGDKYIVQSQNLSFEVPLTQLTDNADIANELRRTDAGAQTQIAGWQNAEREIEKQNKDVENRAYDEAHRRLEEKYNRLRTLRFDSILEQPEHP